LLQYGHKTISNMDLKQRKEVEFEGEADAEAEAEVGQRN